MIYKRYNDNNQLVLNENELKLNDENLIVICKKDIFYGEISVDLKSKLDKFDELKPYIIFVAQNLCKMDSIAQKFTYLNGNKEFAFIYEIGYVYLDAPNIIRLKYYGIIKYAQFDVVFQYQKGNFIIKKFGPCENIPIDWEKEQL